MLQEEKQADVSLPDILAKVKTFWGYDTLRPLQDQAIRAGVESRDSLVVMPTGGGKSLCYQVPPLLTERTDIVVSPLISLMKDQVDGLQRCGYPAIALHSGMSQSAIRDTQEQILDGETRLVFVAPERIVSSYFLNLLKRINVRAFAIDEAHCVSHWGHDFRPEYRQLALLRDHFPRASIHAYTATATPRVREDIIAQLQLRDPSVLIGVFDRPNLTYRVVPRVNVYGQVLEVIRRHAGQAVIVYCISRKDTEAMAAWLKDNKIRAGHYHAGMDAAQRRRTQEAFAEEKLDVIVATVAFGMGIDRSDVRCVIHAALPKSVEHYQQETGRAGRDGLEAECVLFYSASDVVKWESLIERGAEEAENPEEIIRTACELLRHIQSYCNSSRCRHKSLTVYFGQEYERDHCEACDVCLDEMEAVPDATILAQKILSCVARVEQRFGVAHVVDVLLGANTEMIRRCGHDKLSTYALLKGTGKPELTSLIYQLIDQGLAVRTNGDRPVLQLNDASWRVLRKQQEVTFLRARASGVKKTKFDETSWEGVDAGLFESLRELRRTIAEELKSPAFVIFGDATLRELARIRPSTNDAFARIRGVGSRKLADFGERFIARICEYCQTNNVLMDQVAEDEVVTAPKRITMSARSAFKHFAQGKTIEDVMRLMDRARSTTSEYLAEYIAQERPKDIHTWVDSTTYELVKNAATQVGTIRLKPIFEQLGGKVPYDTIRLVASHIDALRK